MQTYYINGSFKYENEPLKSTEPSELANKFVVVEELIDGIKTTFSFSKNAEPIISPKEISDEILAWSKKSIDKIFDLIHDRYVLHGVFAKYKNVIFYDHLCDVFVETDIFDKQNNVFLSTEQRNALINKLAPNTICSAPMVKIGKISSKNEIEDLLTLRSFYKSDKWKNTLLEQCVEKNYNFYKIAHQYEDNSLMKGLSFKVENNVKVLEKYLYIRPGFGNLLASVDHKYKIINKYVIHNP
jgi:hypothetical protein